MRKILTLGIAVLATSLALAGCSSSGGTGGTPSASAGGGDEDITIAMVVQRQNDPYYLSLAKGAEEEAKKLGVTFTWQAPVEQSVANEQAVLESVVASQPDGLLFSAADSDALSAPLKQVFDSGIPVITVDTDVSDESARLAHIATDNVEMGRQGAELMNQLLNGEGAVANLKYTPGVASDDDRGAGWAEGIADIPGFTDAGVEYGTLDVSDNQSKAAGIIARTPDLAGIYATWGNATAGASQAVQQAAKSGQIKVIGNDADPATVALLQSGAIDGIVSQNPYEIGKLAIQAMVDYIKNGTEPKDQLLDPVLISKDNMDDPDVSQYFYVTN